MYFDIKYDIISGTEEKGKEDKVMFCRKCGQKLEGVEKFCPKCGAEVVQVQVPQASEPGREPVQAQVQAPEAEPVSQVQQHFCS